MISVGIDVSKGKSTVCIVDGERRVVREPYDISHTENDLHDLVATIREFDSEVKVVMEATGIYHLPQLTYLKESNIFTAVINPYVMKVYRSSNLRNSKTDRIDAICIANYGIEHWDNMRDHSFQASDYEELKFLSRQYRHYMKLHIAELQNLNHLLDYTMPGLRKAFTCWKESSRKDKLGDFVLRFWHLDAITCYSEDEFIEEYKEWAGQHNYHKNADKAKAIYELAKENIATFPSDTPSLKASVLESARLLKEIDAALASTITRMQEIAKRLPEYSTVRAMNGVGDVLAPRLIAAIGDVTRFHAGKALVAYAGIDSPPHESGQYCATGKPITKRGSASIRKVGYETMQSLKRSGHTDDPVYMFIVKKESEGKGKKASKIAGLNKFLRIYYARVMEVYKSA